MKKVIFLFLINIFLLTHNGYAMEEREDLSRGLATRFKAMVYENGVIKDLRTVPEEQVRKIWKFSTTTLALGSSVRHFSGSSYLDFLCRSAPLMSNRLSPTDLLQLSKAVEYMGITGVVLTTTELYNIWRGSRLAKEFLAAESPQDRCRRNIRNGFADLGLAGLVYVGYPYVGYLISPYLGYTGGTVALYTGATFFLYRGVAGLVVDIPTLAADLDWSVPVETGTSVFQTVKEVAAPAFQKMKEKASFQNIKETLSGGWSTVSAWWNTPKTHTE